MPDINFLMPFKYIKANSIDEDSIELELRLRLFEWIEMKNLPVFREGLAYYLALSNTKGVDVKSDEGEEVTLLMLAARVGHTVFIQHLLDNQAYINRRNSTGKTALMYAAQYGKKAAVALLLKQGASVHHAENTSLRTALHFSIQAIRLGGSQDESIEIVQLLLRYGAVIKGHNTFKCPLLIEAIIYENNKMVEFLIKNGISLNDKDKEGNTALMIATQKRDEPIIDLLLAYSAEVESVIQSALWWKAHGIHSYLDCIMVRLKESERGIFTKIAHPIMAQHDAQMRQRAKVFGQSLAQCTPLIDSICERIRDYLIEGPLYTDFKKGLVEQRAFESQKALQKNVQLPAFTTFKK